MQVSRLSREGLVELRAMLESYVERGVVPGAVAVVSRGNQTHIEAVGNLALGGDTPMTPGSIFRIASVTKPITAAAAMILIEEGKLGLDAPVDDLLPELANRRVLRSIESELDDTVPARRPITTRDLLAFTSGYGFIMAMPGTYPIQRRIEELGLESFGPPGESAHTPDEWLALLGTLPLLHQPGEQWLYNTSAYILGILIERAAGQPFPDVLRERIFEPLGMVDTGFVVPPEKLDRLTSAYATDPESGALELMDAPETSLWSRPPRFPDGGGLLVSTGPDLNAFARMMLQGGQYERQRILSRPSVEMMMSDQLTPEVRANSPAVPIFLGQRSWGFGGAVVIEPDNISATTGRYGWEGGFGTTWQVDPANDITMILLTQAMFTGPNPPPVIHDFWASAYRAIRD